MVDDRPAILPAEEIDHPRRRRWAPSSPTPFGICVGAAVHHREPKWVDDAVPDHQSAVVRAAGRDNDADEEGGGGDTLRLPQGA
ncbi:unnamed protein product [Camellia sinensis]